MSRTGMVSWRRKGGKFIPRHANTTDPVDVAISETLNGLFLPYMRASGPGGGKFSERTGQCLYYCDRLMMMAVDKHKFPSDPVLERLLIEAGRTADPERIVDSQIRLKKSYPQLLGDILKTRDLLHAQLALSRNDQDLIIGDANFVAILTGTGYEFIVAFFAIRATGSTPMPLASGILPEESQYFFSKSKSSCMLVGRDCLHRAEDICASIQEQGSSKAVTTSPISTDADPVSSTDIEIDWSRPMRPDGPGLVLFTSGTTGLPKGVVLPRRCFAHVQPAKPGSATFNCRPGHWFGGARSLIEPLLVGQRLYIVGEKMGKARAEAVLDIFQHNQITYAMFTPELLRQMKDVLIEKEAHLRNSQKSTWTERFGTLSAIRCATGVVEPSTRQFWTDLTGCPFENNYGSTELGGGATVGISKIQGSIGKGVSGVKLKLSEGIMGEILVKSPNMLTHYLDDEELTREAFDEDGYFKTGDLAELKDGEYIYTGRANADFIQFSIFKIPALDVESSLLDLPYISEACIVAVPDNDVKHRCGAIVRLKQDAGMDKFVTLARIRSDLQGKLAPFMLPTLLRILVDNDVLPRTISGKLVRREALKQYFGTEVGTPVKSFPTMVECWKFSPITQVQAKPWDWCGLQRHQ